MAKEVDEKAVARVQAARRAATADGKTWASLSADERRIYKQRVRGTVQAEAANPSLGKGDMTAIRKKAKRAAEAAGQTWRNLTLEERKKYLRQARTEENRA